MARKTSGGGRRNPRGSQDTPVEDAEIVSDADDGASGTVADDPTPTGTASVEAMPEDGDDAEAAAHPGAEGTSEAEAPAPAEGAEDAADPSLGAGNVPGDEGPSRDAWESVPGAVTPSEAGHPEAVEEARIVGNGDRADGDGSGTDLVRAPSVEIVPPDAPLPEPEPEEPTAADAPEVVVTPPPGYSDGSDVDRADGDARHRAFGAGAAGAATGAAAAMAPADASRADGSGPRAGRGTPPDLDPPHEAPPADADGARPAPRTGPAGGSGGGGGFLPLLLGGVLAGLIGLGAGWLLFGQDGAGGSDSGLEAQVAELQARIDGLTGEPDLSPLNARIDEVAAGIPTLTEVEDRLGAIETALAAPEDVPADDPLAGRLEEVEGRFIEVDSLAGAVGELREQFASLASGLADAGEGTTAGTAGREALGQEITSAARRLDALAAEVEALSSGMEGMTGDIDALRKASSAMEGMGVRLEEVAAGAEATRGDLDALVAERDQLVAEAEAEAADARAEAALERLRAAVDAGAPFAEPLAAYEEASGETAPAALSARAEEGVPSLAQLQEEWDGAAREALAEAPAEPGPGGFLRAQLGIRSLNAREGDSADAILSRAEAALRDGDLETALSEIEGLSESPRAALDPWVAEAEERLAATEALAEIDPAAGSETGTPPATDEPAAGASAQDASVQEAPAREEAPAQDAPARASPDDASDAETAAAGGDAASAEGATSEGAAGIDAGEAEAPAAEPAAESSAEPSAEPDTPPAASITPASE